MILGLQWSIAFMGAQRNRIMIRRGSALGCLLALALASAVLPGCSKQKESTAPSSPPATAADSAGMQAEQQGVVLRSGAPWAVVIGEGEAEEGLVVLKDLRRRGDPAEERLGAEELLRRLTLQSP